MPQRRARVRGGPLKLPLWAARALRLPLWAARALRLPLWAALLLAACAPPDGVAEDPFVALVAGPSVGVSASSGSQTHPSIAAEGSGWWVAWDEDGPDARAEVRRLGLDGAPIGEAFPLVRTGGGGFATPDLVADGAGAFAAVRVGDAVELLRIDGDQVSSRVVAGTGEIGFWTAPDLVLTASGPAVGWWDGDLSPSAEASYVVGQWDRDGAVLASPAALAASAGNGSPLAMEPHPDGGWVAAWSESGDGDGAIFAAVVQDGEPHVLGRVDPPEAGASPPSRPAVAVADDETVAIAWRVQDEAQQGHGTWLRWFDAALVPLGDALPLGLAPQATNRVELDGDGDWLVAVWEEATADGDVVLQAFDRAARAPVTGPVRVHDSPAGRQARPTVEVVASGDGAAIVVAFEDQAGSERPQIHVRTFSLTRR